MEGVEHTITAYKMKTEVLRGNGKNEIRRSTKSFIKQKKNK